MGLPVAPGLTEAGFRVVGIDLRQEKVDTINEGRSHLLEVPDERVTAAKSKGLLSASSSFEPLADADAVIIYVPTPGTPDLSKVLFAGEAIAKALKPGLCSSSRGPPIPGPPKSSSSPY